MRQSPYWDTLNTTVEAAYKAFGRDKLSPPLHVCQCPVCMTDETRLAILAERNDALSQGLIQEYSNSAHGVPVDIDNLRLLLPRYLELMSQDVEVDNTGVGMELRRFGETLTQVPDLFSSDERAVLDAWARAMIWHFAWMDTQKEGAVLTPFYLVEVLLAGGWRPEIVTGILDDLFEDKCIGEHSLRGFAGHVMSRPLRKHDRIGVNWYALSYCSDAVRAELVAWLNALAGSERVLDLASDPEREDDWGTLQGFAWAAGTFDADLLRGSA